MTDVLLSVASAITTILLGAGLLLWARGTGRTAEVLMDAGLIILLVMPVARLLDAVGQELRAREWRFAALGFAVLVLLGGSLAIAMLDS